MRLQSWDHLSWWAVKLGPDLDSEHVLTIARAFVKKTNAGQHISLRKLVRDYTENQLLPNCLQKGQVGLEIDPELTTILVHWVLPLGLNGPLEQTHAVDTDWLPLNLNTI